MNIDDTPRQRNRLGVDTRGIGVATVVDRVAAETTVVASIVVSSTAALVVGSWAIAAVVVVAAEVELHTESLDIQLSFLLPIYFGHVAVMKKEGRIMSKMNRQTKCN